MAEPAFDRRSVPGEAQFSSWRSPDGWSLRRLDWAVAKDVRARGSLLFAGGRGDFIEKYLESQHHWHRRGWKVTAFDWRGQGGSRGDIVGGHVDSFDPLLDDLAALVRAWKAENEGPHVLIGHSMGGHLVLRALAEGRAEVDSAVLVAPMMMINSAPLPPFAAEWTASLLSTFGLGRQPAWEQSAAPAQSGSYRQSCLTGCTDRYEDELWWWEQQPGFNLRAPSWGWLKAAYSSCAALTPDKLRALKIPILILGAERDRLVSAKAIREVAAHLPGAELEMFPDAAHEILRERDAVRLAALARIDDFLGRTAR
jgi:lysophospholipase